MNAYLKSSQPRTDWIMLGCSVALSILGLFTMNSFQGDNSFFSHQVLWISIALGVFFLSSRMEWRFLRKSGVAVTLYAIACTLLALLFVIGHVSKGAQSWFSFGVFSIEPAELADLALIVVLAKYFSRRHSEIADFRHIIVSGIYAFILFLLVLLQPDFGGAIIVFALWFFMVLVSGISRKHLLTVFVVGTVVFAGLWNFGFHEYQKQRIETFIHPLTDIRGAGYSAYQSTVAVGSGQWIGKGIGYGSQSKLRYLPEYQTDFIFAAFAEEWGFVGVAIVFALYGTLFVRLIVSALRGATNFETFFTLGILFYLAAHFTLHVGINLGLLPVTGTTIPFMSYGGSHLLAEFLGIGMVCGMRAYGRAVGRNSLDKEFSGGYDR